MSNDRRMNLIVSHYERLGCPDLPESMIPKDKRRDWFTTPPAFSLETSPDDVDMTDVTEEKIDAMSESLARWRGSQARG